MLPCFRAFLAKLNKTVQSSISEETAKLQQTVDIPTRVRQTDSELVNLFAAHLLIINF